MQGLQEPVATKIRRASGSLPALAVAAVLALPQSQTPGIPKAPTVRFHHLHFRTDDFAGVLTAAAGTHGGTRTILEGLGPGIRVGDVYLLFERPPDDRDERAGERGEAAARVDAAAEWLRTRRIEVTLSDAARRVITGPVGDAPLDHVAFAAEDVAAVERTLRTAGVEPVKAYDGVGVLPGRGRDRRDHGRDATGPMRSGARCTRTSAPLARRSARSARWTWSRSRRRAPASTGST